MKGYWGDDDRTAQAFEFGWFHTGDMGFRDRLGFLHFADREKDVIKHGGYSVFSREVEEEILRNPKVLRGRNGGGAAPDQGEVPVAFIQLNDGEEATEEELLRLVQGEHRRVQGTAPGLHHRTDAADHDAQGNEKGTQEPPRERGGIEGERTHWPRERRNSLCCRSNRAKETSDGEGDHLGFATDQMDPASREMDEACAVSEDLVKTGMGARDHQLVRPGGVRGLR